jgi:hypothetical protein
MCDPNARLSLTLQPIMSADVIAATTLYYTNGHGFCLTANVSGLAVGAYDVLLSPDGQSLIFTAMQPTYNTNVRYIGSINVSVAGQLTCHFSIGGNRKFEVYNAHNQRSLLLRVVSNQRDTSYSPKNTTYEPFFYDPTNCGTIITGLPEAVDVTYYQRGFIDTLSGPYALLNSVGWNGAAVGTVGGGTHDDSNTACGVLLLALYNDPAVFGVNVASMLVYAGVYTVNDLSRLWSATSAPPMDSEGSLLIKWRG